MAKATKHPKPPEGLKPAAQKRWTAVYPVLAKRGPVDLEQLRLYCQVWARWREAEDGIDKAGQLTRSATGQAKASPLLAIASKAAKDVRALEQHLGIGAAEEAPPDVGGTWRTVNRQQLAELMGVHPDTISDYTKQGMPVAVPGGTGREGVYDAVACLAWWRDRQGRNAMVAAQTELYRTNTKIAALKLKKDTGELWSRDEIELANQSTIKGWSAQVRALPRLLSTHGFISRHQEAGVAELVADLLREIASWRSIKDIEATVERRSA